MNPVLLSFIIQEVIQYGPAVITEIKSLFASGTPTLADLQALRTKLEAENYAQFVPATAIPANVVPLVSPAAPVAPVINSPVTVAAASVAVPSACASCGAALDGFNPCPCPKPVTPAPPTA